jgi:hypothetical protein
MVLDIHVMVLAHHRRRQPAGLVQYAVTRQGAPMPAPTDAQKATIDQALAAVLAFTPAPVACAAEEAASVSSHRDPGQGVLAGVAHRLASRHIMHLGAFRGFRGADIPADPVAPGSPHHQIEVRALEPSQFLGEHGHTLPPGAVHPGNVSAPEHPPRSERVEHAMQRVMEARKRIGIRRVARLTRRLHRHVRMFRQRDELIEVPIGPLGTDRRARDAQVIDAEASSRMPLGDGADPRQERRGL